MSLILEALRKSEAERRRGQSPDLHGASIIAPTPRRDGFRQWPILAGGTLLLIAVALLLWPRAQPDVDAGDADAQVQADATRDDAAGAMAGEAMSPPRAAEPVSTIPQQGRPSSPPTSVPAPAQAQVAAQLPAAVPTQASPPPRAMVAPLPAPPGIANPPVDAPAVAPPADDLPSLATLSAGERAALPPLKLSVHVWDSNPKQRFAIVDGQRIVEGGTIGSAVVDEIRRDGVVLEMNGRRVLLPKP